MDSTSVANWFSSELSLKKIKVQSLKDLKSGSLFMQTLYLYFPKQANLTKVYIRPKNSFQVIQNFRQILNTFTLLGWKKIDPEKYVKQQDKDCLDIANFIIKKLTALKTDKQNKQQKSFGNFLSVNVNGFDERDNPSYTSNTSHRLQQLTKRKQDLLEKLMKIQYVVNNVGDAKKGKAQILNIISG